MKLWKVMLVGILGVMLSAAATAQTYDLRFRDAGNTGNHFDVAIQIRAVGSPFTLGTSNFVFRYDTSGLGAPTLLAKHRFSGGRYDSIDVRATSQVSVNTYLTTPGDADTVDTLFQDVVTLRFPVKQADTTSSITWVTTGGAPTVVFVGDDSAEAAPGTLEDFIASPLTVQLASFTGEDLGGNRVRLEWITLSQTNNLGFYVQRRASEAEAFADLPNSFQPGMGTVAEADTFSFVDSTVTQGTWQYRLRQVETDTVTEHFSGIISVEVGTVDVAEQPDHPLEFALAQNYPNPFNPSTTIQFSVPRDSRVVLEVYNLLGQRIATLVDEVRPAGHHSVRFNADNLASGIYFYRLSAGQLTFLKKMMVLK